MNFFFIGSYNPTILQFDPVNLKMILGEILILKTLLSEVVWKWFPISAPVLGRWAIFGLRYCSQICPHVFTSVLQLPWESLCYWTPPRILMVFQVSLCLIKMQKPECLSATTIEHQSARDVPLWNSGLLSSQLMSFLGCICFFGNDVVSRLLPSYLLRVN